MTAASSNRTPSTGGVVGADQRSEPLSAWVVLARAGACCVVFAPTITAIAAVVIATLAHAGYIVSDETISLLNPYARLINALGLTALRPGLLVGAAEAFAAPGSVVGLPLVGSFVVWIIASIALLIPRESDWSLSTIVFKSVVVGAVLGCIGQFVLQSALNAMADDLHRQADVDQTRAREFERLEAELLQRVVTISRVTGCMGVSFNSAMFTPMLRLSELQAKGSGPNRPQRSVRVRLDDLTIDFRSNAIGVELPQSADRMKHFQAYKGALRTLSVDADVDALGALSPFDPLLQLAMSSVNEVAASYRLFKVIDKALPTFDPHLVIELKDTTAAKEYADAAHGVYLEDDMPLEARAVYDHRDRIQVFMNVAEYRSEVASVLAAVAAQRPSSMSEGTGSLGVWTTNRVNGPIAHEMWHFWSSKGERFRGLPLAVDEGMATVFEALAQAIDRASQPEMSGILGSRDRLPDTAARDRIEEAALSGLGSRESQYIGVLEAAAKSETLLAHGLSDARKLTPDVLWDELKTLSSPPKIKARDLLAISSGEIKSLLPYAEGWIIAIHLCFDPERVRRISDAVAEPQVAASLWSEIDQWLAASPDATATVRHACMRRLFKGEELHVRQ